MCGGVTLRAAPSVLTAAPTLSPHPNPDDGDDDDGDDDDGDPCPTPIGLAVFYLPGLDQEVYGKGRRRCHPVQHSGASGRRSILQYHYRDEDYDGGDATITAATAATNHLTYSHTHESTTCTTFRENRK
jgi:hypothetical protein